MLDVAGNFSQLRCHVGSSFDVDCGRTASCLILAPNPPTECPAAAISLYFGANVSRHLFQLLVLVPTFLIDTAADDAKPTQQRLFNGQDCEVHVSTGAIQPTLPVGVRSAAITSRPFVTK
jgi:hypothetical protein